MPPADGDQPDPIDEVDDPLDELKQLLRRLRDLRGWKMSRLETGTALSHVTVSQALNGPAVPSEATVTRIARALSVDGDPSFPADTNRLLALRKRAEQRKKAAQAGSSTEEPTTPVGYTGRQWQEPERGRRSTPDIDAGVALMRVPAPGELFQSRSAVHERAVELLSKSGSNAIIVGLVGMSGAGKTSLAQAIAHDLRIRSRFPDGVWWLVAGERSDVECQAAVWREFDPGRAGLGGRLSRARSLIVLDNVVRPGQINATAAGLGPGSALLVTTWDRTLRHDITYISVEKWKYHEARNLLAVYAGEKPDALPAAADYVLARCDGLPIALAVCGAMVKHGYSWGNTAGLLRKAALEALETSIFPDYYPPSLFAALAAGVTSLTEQELARYTEMAIFAGRGPVPVEVAARLWSRDGLGRDRLDADDTTRIILRLRDRSLLVYRRDESPTFQLHDLQYDYVRFLAGERLSDLHGELAATYVEVSGDLAVLDPATADEYGLINIPHHLVEAGQDDLLHVLLTTESNRGENAWLSAHEELGLTARYLADLRLAQTRARRATDTAATAVDRGPNIALEIRYALMRSSLTSVADTIPPNFLAALVRHGLWSFDKAGAYARVIPSPQNRAGALTALARFTEKDSTERLELITEAKRAAAGIESGVYRAFAIQRLILLAPKRDQEELFEEAWAAADTDRHQPSAEIRAWLLHNAAQVFPERVVHDLRRGVSKWNGRFDYPEVMVAVLPQLPELREDVLAIARKRNNERLGAKALNAVLGITRPNERAELVGEALALIDDAKNDFVRKDIVITLMSYLPTDRVRSLLAEILEDASPHWRLSALVAALPYLPAYEKPAALTSAQLAAQEVDDRIDDDDLLALRPFLNEPEWTQLVEKVIGGSDGSCTASGVRLVCKLARRGASLSERILLQAVDAVESTSPPGEALNKLAPYLPPHLLRRALIRCVPAESSAWTPALAHVAPGHDVPEKTAQHIAGPPQQLLREGCHVCPAIHELAQLIPLATPARRREMIRAAVEAGLHGHDFDDFPCGALAAVAGVAHLVPVTERLPLSADVTDLLIPDDNEERMRQLALLAIYQQDSGVQSEALSCVAAIGASEHWRAGLDAVSTLVHLARYLSNARLLEAADVACGLRETGDQATALAALTKHAASAIRSVILPKTLTAMRSITKPHDLTRPLAELFPYVTVEESAELLDRLINIADPVNKFNLDSLAGNLAKIASDLPIGMFPQAAHAVETLPVAEDRAKASRALAVAWGAKHPGEWSEYWRTALDHAATAGRPAVLALITQLPLTEFGSLAECVSQAMLDVRRWWPSGS